MKFFFLIAISIFFLYSCSGQYNPQELSKVDTVKLFDPKPNKSDDLDLQDLSKLENVVFIQDDNYNFIFNGQEYEIYNTRLLDTFFINYSNAISKNRFFILYDGSNLKFKKITNLIDKLEANDVVNYRVINFQHYFKPNISVTISEPVIVTAESVDTLFIKITIESKNYILTLPKQTEVFTDTLELGKFIEKNNALIANKKIVVISEKNSSFDRAIPIIEFLKNYNSNFKISFY